MPIDFRGDLPQFLAFLRQVPSVLIDDPQVAQSLQLRLGVQLLSCVQQDFIVKSRGGTGRDGITWPPLARSTIAQRRTTSAERKSAGVGGKRVRGLLTAAQDKRWRQIYASRLARLRLVMSEGAAQARAAEIAWAVLKSEGAKTKLDVFGGRKVDMLRDTGRLLRSLSPGVEDRPSGADGQVFQPAGPGRVIVGTNVVYAERLHRGVPGKTPSRPLWPLDGSIPAAWLEQIATAMVTGVARAITLVLQRGTIR